MMNKKKRIKYNFIIWISHAYEVSDVFLADGFQFICIYSTITQDVYKIQNLLLCYLAILIACSDSEAYSVYSISYWCRALQNCGSEFRV